MLQYIATPDKRNNSSRQICVDSPEVTEGTLKLPSINNATLRSASAQKKTISSQSVMPAIEETKFLSMPMRSANRVFTRAVSAKKPPRSNPSLQLNQRTDSARSTAVASTISVDKPDSLQRHVARIEKVK